MLNFNKLLENLRIFTNNEAKKEVALFSKTNFSFSFKPFLLMQGAVVFVAVLLSFFISVNLFFPKHQIADTQLIKTATTKQLTAIVTNGQPVKWLVIVKRSDITKNQNLIKLPKSATNIKVKIISTEQAEIILAQTTPEPKLTMADRQQLAMASKPKNFLAKISNFLFANLEQAVGDAVQQITEQANPDVTQTSDANVVDLSKQELKDQEKEVAKENKKEESGPAIEEPAPMTPEIPAPSVEPIEMTSPSDQPVLETPQESLLEMVSPSDQQAVQNPNEAQNPNDQTVPAPKDEAVQIDYETPSPTITEQETEKGKLVTVSDSNQGPNPPQLTDVVAYTTIPEIYKVGQESKIKIKWTNEGGQEMPFTAYDLNSNGKIDYIEWTVPHLSDQYFEIIFISKAFELDENQEIINDIYDQVKEKDNTWATVAENHYVRATFYLALNNARDITVHARPAAASSTSIEVYPVYTDENGNQTEGQKLDLVNDGQHPDFFNIDHEDTYRVLLTNLQTPTDVFDLKVTGGDIDFDYIVDPTPATVTDTFTDATKIASNTGLTVDTGNGQVALTVGSSWTCGSSLIDTRDGKTYTTVLIGAQCWMRQNINVGTLTAGANTQGTDCPSATEIEKYCYSDVEGNCTTYGGLYQWNQAMCGSTTAGATGICPTGWHIPTHDEYTTLELAVCTSGSCATDFPYDVSTTGWRGTNEGTTLKTVNSSSFSGLLAGYRTTDGSFVSITSGTFFWSSVQSSSYAWDRYLYSSYATVNRNTDGKAYGFSVRCLKN